MKDSTTLLRMVIVNDLTNNQPERNKVMKYDRFENVACLCLAGSALFSLFACVSELHAAPARPARLARPAVVRRLANVAHLQSRYVVNAQPSGKSQPR